MAVVDVFEKLLDQVHPTTADYGRVGLRVGALQARVELAPEGRSVCAKIRRLAAALGLAERIVARLEAAGRHRSVGLERILALEQAPLGRLEQLLERPVVVPAVLRLPDGRGALLLGLVGMDRVHRGRRRRVHAQRGL